MRKWYWPVGTGMYVLALVTVWAWNPTGPRMGGWTATVATVLIAGA